ncbi:restriction endonuclease subunit S [Cloacibacterium sp. Arc13]|uniref:restriction endonuclease subunit S n=1 Tax=unclassified Cloacibacterium TaxID=2620870 RepID=UPI00352DFD65
MTDIQKENKSGGKVPNLRFPEFTEQWESKPLREVVKINQGLQIAISERSTENKTGSYFYITNEFLKAGSGKKYYILNPPQSVICNEKDILMTRTGNTGQVVTNVSGAFHNNFFKVAYPEYIDKIFLYNFLKLNKTQNQILRFAGTSTIPDLNHSDFYRIIISFPSNKEQQKIASFLSLIDERITTQNKIINDLKTLKIATAKKIFSGELRFKDDNGNDFSEWEDKKLGDISIKKSSNISANTLEENQGNFKIYGANGLLKEIDFYREEKPYIAIVKDGAGVGRLLLCEGKSSVLGTLDIIKNKEQTDLLFLYYLLETIDFTKFTTGSTIPHIYFKDYSKEIIGLPSFPEQTKIANFLSSIDSKIDIENQLLQKLEAQKKYLLQNMFV